jgi:hypothetical protein
VTTTPPIDIGSPSGTAQLIQRRIDIHLRKDADKLAKRIDPDDPPTDQIPAFLFELQLSTGLQSEAIPKRFRDGYLAFLTDDAFHTEIVGIPTIGVKKLRL